MKQFDTRWFTFPVACLLAIVLGDISWWVMLPVIIGCCPIFLNFKGRN